MRPLATTLVLLTVLAPLSARGPRRQWDFAPYSHLKRTEAEKGSPANSQPLRVAPETLAKILISVNFQEGEAEGTLFLPAEADAVSRALAEALALIGPGEDLELLSTWKRDRSLMGSALGITARVFARDGRINLIVHDSRLDWVLASTMTPNTPSFNFGSRAAAGKVFLRAPGVDSHRADWLVLPILPAPAESTPASASAAPEPGPATAAPNAVAPASKRGSAPSIEDRLRDLKRFRDQNLITEEEYAQQKQELFKEFRKGEGGA